MTDRKPQEILDHEKLYHESQSRFETIFEASRLGNKIISSDLKIRQVNPAMVALLGYEHKEDLLGTRILDYTPNDNHKDWETLQEKLWKTQMPSFSLETRLIKKDGSIIWCKVNSILFKDKGETFGYTIIEDITEQHHLKMHKEDFIGVASHELKTPLTSLRICLQIMGRLIRKETTITDRIIKLSQNADIYAERLSQLVNDLLNTTKIEQGQFTLNKSRFKLSGIVDECCNHLKLDEKHHLTVEGDLSVEVEADKNKIDQVLVNFVNNAVKYAPDSAEINILVEQFDQKVKVSVTDKGDGIPKQDIPHLFNRYYQVKKEKSPLKGLGLGLYISAEIIKRHHGEIGVDSTLGKGSTFWFTIPMS